MSDHRIARRYGKALLGLCEKDKSYEAVGRDLDKVVDALQKEPTVFGALVDPSISSRTKAEVLRSVSRSLLLRPTTSHFLLYLAEKGRVDALPSIREDFSRRLDDVQGRIRARVASARPLTVIEKKRVEDALKKATGKTIVLEAAVDDGLLGGVVTRVGNLVLDGSVRSQLDSLKTRLRHAVE